MKEVYKKKVTERILEAKKEALDDNREIEYIVLNRGEALKLWAEVMLEQRNYFPSYSVLSDKQRLQEIHSLTYMGITLRVAGIEGYRE